MNQKSINQGKGMSFDTGFDPATYLFNLQHFGIKLGLDRMQSICAILDHPEKKFKTIHVTGTNGKGSTSAFLASVYRAAGFKVGLYTSPHLVRFNERIKVNSEEISDEELLRLTLEIKEKIEEFENKENEKCDITFFEFTTAVAFSYFALQEVDIAIIEVGLGGRLDATNVVDPLVSVITNIDFDHTSILGNDLLSIAHEKAGIIKENVPLITGEKNSEVLDFFKNVCSKKHSEFIPVKFNYELINNSLHCLEFSYLEENYKLKMLGKHQIENSILVIETVKKINEIDNSLFVSLDILKQGLFNAFWPGRLQVYSTSPLIMFDGAHNIAGVNTLVDFLEGHKNELFFENRKSVLVIGISKDKDAKFILEKLSKYFSSAILVEASHKPTPVLELKSIARNYFESVEISSVNDALSIAKEKVGSSGFVLVTGSLYVVGDVLKSLSDSLHLSKLNLSGANHNV